MEEIKSIAHGILWAMLFIFVTHVTPDWNADDADNADFHGFVCFRLFDYFLSKQVITTRSSLKQKTLTKIVERLAQKIRENPCYLHHPCFYQA